MISVLLLISNFLLSSFDKEAPTFLVSQEFELLLQHFRLCDAYLFDEETNLIRILLCQLRRFFCYEFK